MAGAERQQRHQAHCARAATIFGVQLHDVLEVTQPYPASQWSYTMTHAATYLASHDGTLWCSELALLMAAATCTARATEARAALALRQSARALHAAVAAAGVAAAA